MIAPDGLRFAGYAAVFDRPDSSGDVVRRGAFDAAQKAVPLLWQHQPTAPIGVIEHLSEDAHGLRVIGRLNGGTQQAREAAALLRANALNGLSIGYRIRSARRGPAARELNALDLIEISLVTFPMQTLARVHAVAGLGAAP